MFSVKIMSIKKCILTLENDFKKKFPELNATFYSSRRNMCVHMGLDKAIFAYSNFNKIINELNNFFDEHLAEKFKTNYPQLIHSSKWKFDYIIARKKFSSSRSN